MLGPTSAAFGRTHHDRDILYITSNGGIVNPPSSGIVPGRLSSIDRHIDLLTIVRASVHLVRLLKTNTSPISLTRFSSEILKLYKVPIVRDDSKVNKSKKHVPN